MPCGQTRAQCSCTLHGMACHEAFALEHAGCEPVAYGRCVGWKRVGIVGFVEGISKAHTLTPNERT